jgi:acyl dehydratase
MKFAQFHEGQVLEFGSCTVSEEDILEFARRYDPQPFHIDKVAAESTRWKGLIASGFHTCSLAMRMVVDHVLGDSESMGSPGIESVKWPNPVRAGDTLRVRAQILQAQPSSTGRVGVLRWQWLLLNQHAQPVLDLVVTSLFDLHTNRGQES